MSHITTTSQRLNIDEVLSIVVSDVVPVGDQFVRTIRFFGMDPYDPSATSPVLLLEVKASSPSAKNVTITAPPLGF